MNLKGFTLIELLIVVSIISILSGVVIVILNPGKFTGRARDGVRKQDLAIVKGALEQYYAENNQYPTDSELTFGSEWKNYIRTLPQDPKFASDSWSYCYHRNDLNNFQLCARVEDKNNSNGTSWPCISAGSDPLEFISYCVQNAL